MLRSCSVSHTQWRCLLRQRAAFTRAASPTKGGLLALGLSQRLSSPMSVPLAAALFLPREVEKLVQDLRDNNGGLQPSAFELKSIVYGYGRLGLFQDLLRVVDQMERSGQHVEMVSLLRRMRDLGVPFSIRTYNSVTNSWPTIMRKMVELKGLALSIEELNENLEGGEAMVVRELLSYSVILEEPGGDGLSVTTISPATQRRKSSVVDSAPLVLRLSHTAALSSPTKGGLHVRRFSDKGRPSRARSLTAIVFSDERPSRGDPLPVALAYCYLNQLLHTSSFVYIKRKAYEYMVSGLCAMDRPREAEKLVQDLRDNNGALQPSAFELKSIVYGYGRLGLFQDLLRVVDQMERTGFVIDTVFSNMILSTYGIHRQHVEMFSWLRRMRDLGVPFSIRTYNSVTNSCPTIMRKMV
ncbi:Tetratricopeptide-like helical domain superfamily [Sesbania bispinosa]|nr:Tetratricopeptide-like helical domain superfamily [Sesbania bispinosa]